MVDPNGQWGWDKIDKDTHLRIVEVLKGLEGKSVAEIYKMAPTNHHPVQIADFSKQAQNRIVELKLDDQDELFSFRFSGTERLWGIFAQDCCYLVWWDPLHEVCPSTLKHT